MNTQEHYHRPWRVNRDSQQIGDICAGDMPIAQVQIQAPLGNKKDGNQLREILADQIVAEHNALVGVRPEGIAYALKMIGAFAENHPTAGNCKMMAIEAMKELGLELNPNER